MATSKQTKTHSKDPHRTSGYSQVGGAPEDSASHLRIPAKEHLEYQHWYETETEKKGFSFRKMYNDFRENPSSSTLSIIILVLITVFSLLAGYTAIRLIPVSKATSLPGLFRWNIYKKVSPEHVGYEPTKAILLPLDKPTCFALDSEDRLYVGGDSRIVVFDPAGEKLASLLLDDTPSCLGISRLGCLFENHLLVGYRDAVEVYKILPDEIGPKPVFRWELPGQTPYLKRVLADQDSLILADAGEKGIYRVNAEGDITLRIGFAQGGGPDSFSGFSIPTLPFLDIVESPTEGIFFITNPGKHRIEAFTKSGEWLPQRGWGSISVYSEGFCGCCNPSGLICFPDGRFLTTEKHLSRVKVYDSTGEFQTVVATPEELEKTPAGTTIDYRPEDAARPVQAAVSSDGVVVVFDPRYCCVRFYREK